LIKNLEYLLPHLDMRRHLVPQKMFVGNRIPMAGARIRTARRDSDVIRRRPCSARPAERMRSITCPVGNRSFFDSSGALKPALTVMGNALCVADYLLERRGARTSVPMDVAL
jgi:hypothetical protein